jgi:hypothetical protein
MGPVECVYEAATELETSTDTVQLPDAGTVAPETARPVPPAVAVTVPPQVVVPFAGDAFTKFVG